MLPSLFLLQALPRGAGGTRGGEGGGDFVRGIQLMERFFGSSQTLRRMRDRVSVAAPGREKVIRAGVCTVRRIECSFYFNIGLYNTENKHTQKHYVK